MNGMMWLLFDSLCLLYLQGDIVSGDRREEKRREPDARRSEERRHAVTIGVGVGVVCNTDAARDARRRKEGKKKKNEKEGERGKERRGNEGISTMSTRLFEDILT